MWLFIVVVTSNKYQLHIMFVIRNGINGESLPQSAVLSTELSLPSPLGTFSSQTSNKQPHERPSPRSSVPEPVSKHPI